MSRLIWLTDIHFNVCQPARRLALLDEVARRSPSGVLIGGDIGDAPTFAGYLREIVDAVSCPVYFVLGNHDYYRGSMAEVHAAARQLCSECPRLHWLTDAGGWPLDDGTMLIGHDGWGDARSGDFDASTIVLNDYFLISDLRSADGLEASAAGRAWEPREILTPRLKRRLQQLGMEAAESLRRSAEAACEAAQEIVVLMHVPPFREACWYDGRLSDDNWAPHFVCAAAGESLRDVMQAWPDRRMTVLCGHTHHGGRAEMLPNLTVITGEAVYGDPRIQTAWPPSASLGQLDLARQGD